MRAVSARVNIGYVRLSRMDMDDNAEPIEVKLEKRKRIVENLAFIDGVEIKEEDWYVERESGTTIAKRAGFSEIIERCQRKEVARIYTPYQDRISRTSLKDESVIVEAFKRSKVLLVTTEGRIDFGNKDFDTTDALLFTIKNAVARQYIADYSKKLREINRIKAQEGKKLSGSPPYAYSYVKPVYKNRQLVQEARWEIDEAKYAIVCEIFERAKREGMISIGRDLQRRYEQTGFPETPQKAMFGKETRWTGTCVAKIVKNPFYAGYVAHRYEREDGKFIRIPRSDWVMSKAVGLDRHPVTLAEWEEVQDIMAQRRSYEQKTTHRVHMFAKILRCTEGKPMYGAYHEYRCCCNEYGPMHAFRQVSKHKIDTVCLQVLRESLEALPDAFLPAVKVEKRHHRDEIETLTAQFNEEQQKLNDLNTYIGMMVRIHGEAGYERMVREAKERVSELEGRIAGLRLLAQLPDLNDLKPVLVHLKKMGVENFLANTDERDIHHLAKFFFDSVRILPSPTRNITAIHVELREWLSEYLEHTSFKLELSRYASKGKKQPKQFTVKKVT